VKKANRILGMIKKILPTDHSLH